MNNRTWPLHLNNQGIQTIKSVVHVGVENFYKKPENMAAFEEWKAKRDQEAKDADKH